MTKKDYITIAAAIAEVKVYNSDEENISLKIATSLANVFKWDNPKFDRDKFLKACNPMKGDR